ncbi:Serine/arginine repetitive matrix protein 2 [Rhodotorula toruloides ATCC 204091]|uniref:Serine/arginine repetitive matrix protein 2 n=1 Tax=Rhodotorula toruloides TaxID=5286 RepID=A0A0K3CH58_RHOTO|nr:Serine/arginine repetitive matrix protein 2 [Rhodotorula toruloides ATCC 204091]KAK4332919.1 Serine/arginine repetitive matrix protein 2 [Rhodotorula toruloides]PRQ73727.1 Serine/arginine repetitive matrix protein 2 [Rhodotorula toruloides]
MLARPLTRAPTRRIPLLLLPHTPAPSSSLALAPGLTRAYARTPQFTTPDEPLYSTPAQSPSNPHLPPTALSQDDYASPVLSIGLTFRRVFRYAVFASVGIVLTVAGGYAGTHWWIEHVQLSAPKVKGQDDPDEWLDEREGWSGLHTAKRGGTDPRLGIKARMAVRAAYFAQTSGTGTAALPAENAVSNPDSAFAVTRPGGRFISSEDDLAALGAQVNDSSWLEAEQYLVTALALAQDKGISLIESLEWEKHVEQGGVDRAAVELEERLAGIRELIGGRPRLEAARDGWERIYYALSASPTSDPARGEEQEWEQREKVKASRKMAEVSARIAELWREGSDERRAENRRAEGWFVGGLIPALAASEGQSLKGDALDKLVPEGEGKSVSPKSSWFAFWSRRQPTASSSASTSTSSSGLSPELAHLVALIPSAPSAPLSPATHRSILSSLISLETFLARRRDDPSSSTRLPPTLPSAQAVQSAALAYARTRLERCDPLPSVVHLASSTPSLPSSTSLSRALSTLFYTTRHAALSTHHAECALALSPRASSTTLSSSLASIRAATTDARMVIDASAALEARLETARSVLGGESEEEKAFGGCLRRVRRDAERVVKMGEGLERVVSGMQGKR